MPSVLTIGSTFIDINIQAKSKEGQLAFMTNYNVGGKAFNIASGLTLFGVKSYLATPIGNEMLGDQVIQEANNKGIILTKESNNYNHTPIACLVTNSVSGETTFDKVDTSLFDEQKIPVMDFEFHKIIVSSNCNQKILGYLGEYKKQNPATDLVLTIAGSKDISKIQPFLTIFDTLFCNRKEAKTLQESYHYEGNFESFIKYLLSLNFSKVIITLDTEGLVAGIKNNANGKINIFRQRINHEFQEPIINTVGAGDALVSTIVGLENKVTFEKSLEVAMRVTSLHIRNQYSSLQFLPPNLY